MAMARPRALRDWAIPRGEVAVGDILFGHVDYVGEAEACERFGDEAYACAVDRSVDDLQSWWRFTASGLSCSPLIAVRNAFVENVFYTELIELAYFALMEKLTCCRLSQIVQCVPPLSVVVPYTLIGFYRQFRCFGRHVARYAYLYMGESESIV